MGQIFSKCLGSPEKGGKQPVAPTNATPSRVAIVPHEPIVDQPGSTAIPIESTQPPTAVDTHSNELTVPLSQAAAPAPKTAVRSSKERRAELLIPVRPMSNHRLFRDFWGEAVELLPKEYKLPEEWRVGTIDGESVVGMVKAKMEECKDKQWKIEINGTEVIVREVFGKTLDWMQKLAVIGDAVVQYAPFNASLPWQGFRSLLKVAVSDSDAYRAMLAGLERATWLASYCSAQERLYREYFADNDKYSNLNNAFIQDLVHLNMAILKFLIRAHKYYAQGTAARVADAIMGLSHSVEGLTQEINDRKGSMEDYASLVHKSNVQQSLKDVLGKLEPFSEYVSEKAKRRKDKDRQEFLHWISDIDYRGDHDANSLNILSGSGNWMLNGEEKFRSWKAGGGLLWLWGIVGAGKTKLTSTIINHLTRTDENQTVAYFYCVRDTKQPRKEDPEEILRAILKQLVILLPSRLSAPIKAKYEEEKEKGREHSSIRSLTFEDCARFIVKLATGRPLTIVIDALDECRENKRNSSRGSRTDRHDLLRELIVAKDANVKVFLSSRDDVDILRRLEKYPTITMNASKNRDDILNFIKSEVEDLMTERSDWSRDKTLRKEIITAVNNRSNGMFRFAALQISYLSSLNTTQSVRNRLQNLPTTLVQLYNEIYGRISDMVEEETSMAKQALSWLLCAYRQLRSSELLAAVSSKQDQPVGEDELLRICRHFVVRNPASKSFELAHLSVREYLEDRDEYRGGRPHALVAERCIKIFELDAPEGTLDRYASLYWADHYTSTVETEEDTLTDIVKKFFRNKGNNPAFEKWEKIAEISSKALPRDDNLARRLRDAQYKPLPVVSVFGLLEVVPQWMDTAPDYSFFRDSDDIVVHLAIKWGNKDIVRLFLQDKQPVIDKFGWTSSVWAGFYKQLPVLEVLRELYGDVNAKDEMGWTALHWMVFLGHTDGLKVLLRVGARPNMTDEAKWTPLHWAAFLDRDTEAKELAVERQGLDAKDHDELTPFQWAKILGHESTAKNLWTRETVGSFSSSLSTLDGLEVRRAKRVDLGLLTAARSSLLSESSCAFTVASRCVF